MHKISAVIIAGDEENNIYDCLESVKWADEIIVVNSESKDRTVEIAKKFTDKVYVKKWEGYAKQKEYALSLASNEWVLSLDADERVTSALKNEILSHKGENDGYLIPRENYFLDKHITTCGWNNDYQLRLFKKSKTSVNYRLVHEGFAVNGTVGKLDNPLAHLTHITLSKTFAKINEYSSLQAEELYSGKNVTGWGIVLHSLSAFLRYFFSQKGYKDGVRGLMVSLINSVTTMQTYMKIWEIKNIDTNKKLWDERNS
jgi:glycosyltransferase involved in cell wall biosynthesis